MEQYNTLRSSKVFVSYSHDSSQHKERVLQFSNRLRTEGIDCNIDQYEISPSQGWPRWMNDQIEEADYVLVVCTEKYEKRFRGKDEAGKGLGSNFEGLIITQELYEAAKNTQFIPVIFSSEDSNYIPIILKSATRYNLDTEEAYIELYARLTGQKTIIKPDLGELRSITPRNLSPSVSTQDKDVILVESIQKPVIGDLRTITTGDRNSEIPKTLTSTTIGNVSDLFNSSIIERIRKFRGDRITEIYANKTSVALNENAKIILHLIPLSSISSEQTYDMDKLPFDPRLMQPFFSMSWNHRYNIDGYLTYSIFEDKASSYVQLFRNGIFEAVESSLLEKSDLKIPSVAFEEEIMNAFKRYIFYLKDLNVGMPVFAFLTFIGAKGYSMTSHPSWIFRGDTIEKEVLLLPEIVIENFEFEVEEILKPWFDTVWNACGFSRSLNFDSSGKWTGRARR